MPYTGKDTFNLANSGYTFPGRWGKFLREYTTPEGFAYFLHDLGSAKVWKDVGYTCPVKAAHSSGNCLLGISGHVPGPRQRGRITLHSRATILAPTGALDLGIGVAIIKAMAEHYNHDPLQYDLVWNIGHAQLINWKAINSYRLFGIYDSPDQIPDTLVGRGLKQAMESSIAGNLPNIKMFYRQGIKFKRYQETGYIGSGRTEFYPFIPGTHIPAHIILPEDYNENLDEFEEDDD